MVTEGLSLLQIPPNEHDGRVNSVRILNHPIELLFLVSSIQHFDFHVDELIVVFRQSGERCVSDTIRFASGFMILVLDFGFVV